MRLNLRVNGRARRVDDVWEGESLLYVLRERLGLPGSKNACEQGECGSCTVRLDDVLVCSCLVAAGQAEGREVLTVEGLAGTPPHDGGEPAPAQGEPAPTQGEPAPIRLAPIQQAFVDAGAVQCGFCTPGLLLAADDLLRRDSDPSDADIREALSGNLCRCTGYEKILDAVRLAAARRGAATDSAVTRPGEGG
ncbi:(2Fe-2S)-binding protein [Streptomyces sp. O3]